MLMTLVYVLSGVRTVRVNDTGVCVIGCEYSTC